VLVGHRRQRRQRLDRRLAQVERRGEIISQEATFGNAERALTAPDARKTAAKKREHRDLR
jgi:hypothetical protein